MKIIAYLPIFQEADVLPFVLAHMKQQGIQVHALDGWSTDGSYEILRAAWPDVTVERFPAEGPAKEQVCRQILKRIEELAPQSGADWCYLSDADEWRRSPRPNETLAEAIARVDARGYTAIDHQVFAFFCTDDGWHKFIPSLEHHSGTCAVCLKPSHNMPDPESYFRFYNTSDMICQIPQMKCWKNDWKHLGRVQLNSGHIISFPGLRMCPEKFVMKHYPFRNSTQAREKLRVRLERRCHEEHRAGWGVHYDEQFPPSFLWDPKTLREWRDTQTALP